MIHIIKKSLILITLLLNFAFGQAQNLDYPYQGVPFNQVKLQDPFWMPRVETNRLKTIPYAFAKCEETGRVQNFIQAAKHEGKFLTVYPFDDTDLYKIIEGASFSLSVHPDKQLDHYVDSLIAIIAAAQEPDGYLYTSRTINPQNVHGWGGKERWEKVWDLSHELYNCGHLYEAAAAHYLATGKRNFLNVALKSANLLVKIFGPGKRNDPPGHQIVEMGLVRLYRITAKKEYLDLAKFFIDSRGQHKDRIRPYSQDHLPVADQREAVGHAVRAGYFYSGVADVAALTGNKEYLVAIDSLWENVVGKKFYINGGIGARHAGEAFGDNYELPNKSAYNETCAAIANVYWNFRMFELHGNSKYMDVLERSLYNNVLSGVSLDGMKFFYPNPLSADTTYNRQPWFDCSCCPTNMTRFVSSVSGYVYAQHHMDVFVNLYIGSKTHLVLAKGKKVTISQTGNYPWDGNIQLTVDPARAFAFALKLRIPGWLKDEPVPSKLYSYQKDQKLPYTIKVNGREQSFEEAEGYAVIYRKWKKGDKVEFHLPMEVRKVVANAAVKADAGLIALERGPLLYCMEDVDNSFGVNNIVIPEAGDIKVVQRHAMLGGILVLEGEAVQMEISRPAVREGGPVKMPYIKSEPVKFTAIPYSVWNNRGATNMRVWFPQDFNNLRLTPRD